MSKLWLFLGAVIGLLLIGGALFLYSWDIPAPQERVEKTLPDDRFPR